LWQIKAGRSEALDSISRILYIMISMIVTGNITDQLPFLYQYFFGTANNSRGDKQPYMFGVCEMLEEETQRPFVGAAFPILALLQPELIAKYDSTRSRYEKRLTKEDEVSAKTILKRYQFEAESKIHFQNRGISQKYHLEYQNIQREVRAIADPREREQQQEEALEELYNRRYNEQQQESKMVSKANKLVKDVNLYFDTEMGKISQDVSMINWSPETESESDEESEEENSETSDNQSGDRSGDNASDQRRMSSIEDDSKDSTYREGESRRGNGKNKHNNNNKKGRNTTESHHSKKETKRRREDNKRNPERAFSNHSPIQSPTRSTTGRSVKSEKVKETKCDE
jgi:hypothetical protein